MRNGLGSIQIELINDCCNPLCGSICGSPAGLADDIFFRQAEPSWSLFVVGNRLKRHGVLTLSEIQVYGMEQ